MGGLQVNTILKMGVAAAFAALLVRPVLLCADTVPVKSANTVREEITPLTKEQLNTKVPHFYCFNYEGEPQPGKRYWLRVSAKRWIERYPDGLESKFKVVGHAVVRDMPGTIVVKITGDEAATGAANGGGLQAFIPDKGSAIMHHCYRNIGRGDEQWQDLAPMLSVE